jgi:hypothetical protein
MNCIISSEQNSPNIMFMEIETLLIEKLVIIALALEDKFFPSSSSLGEISDQRNRSYLEFSPLPNKQIFP